MTELSLRMAFPFLAACRRLAPAALLRLPERGVSCCIAMTPRPARSTPLVLAGTPVLGEINLFAEACRSAFIARGAELAAKASRISGMAKWQCSRAKPVSLREQVGVDRAGRGVMAIQQDTPRSGRRSNGCRREATASCEKWKRHTEG